MDNFQEACKVADRFENATLPSLVVAYHPCGGFLDGNEVVARRTHALSHGYPYSAVVPLKRERIVDGVAVEGKVLLEKYFKTRESANAFVKWICYKMPIMWAHVNLIHPERNSRKSGVYGYLSAEDFYKFERDDTTNPLLCKISHGAW